MAKWQQDCKVELAAIDAKEQAALAKMGQEFMEKVKEANRSQASVKSDPSELLKPA